jgi:hypothetical protein
MPLLISLFSPVFTQRMRPFNSLLLALAAGLNQSLCDIAAIRSISMLVTEPDRGVNVLFTNYRDPLLISPIQHLSHNLYYVIIGDALNAL